MGMTLIIRLTIIVSIIVLGFTTTSCGHATTLMKLDKSLDDIDIKYKHVGDSISIDFFNRSKTESYYLFSSYFKPWYANSKYLFRYDPEAQSFKISFLPIVNYINTVPTDKRIITDEALFNEHQVVYEFVEIKPGNQFSLTLHESILCRKGSLEKVILDFDTDEVTWAEIEKQSTSSITANNKTLLEFAFYKTIDVLLNRGEEYRNPKRFKSKAKAYEKISVQLICK